MTDNNLITVSEIGELAPDLTLTAYTDPTLSGMISGASKQVSDYLGYTPLAEDIVDELKDGRITSEGDLVLYPEKLPVVSLSSVVLTKGTATVTVSLSDGTNDRYNIPVNRRQVRFNYSDILLGGNPVVLDVYSLRNTQFFVKYSYRGGYEVSNLPYVFKQATLLYLRDALSRAQNPSGAKRISQGGISLEFSQKNGKSDLVEDAERLLAPYRRIV